MESNSSNDGSSWIGITFDPSRNLDVAAVDVQNRVATATARLPNEVKQTGITVSKNSSTFVLAVALYAEHGEYDQKFLSNYADVFLKDALKRVPGVANVEIFGERKFAMRIWLNPEKLAQRGLTAGDVVSALAEQNLQVPAGQIGQPPATKESDFQISLQVAGRLVEERDFERIVLKAEPGGTIVRLGDVGRAELGAEDYSSSMRFNGREAVGLGILQLSTANALEVRNKVIATLERLAARFPPGLKWVDAFDTTLAVSASVKEVVFTLVEAILLVVAVIFLFLQTGTSTLIPSITIPVSLVGTFAFVKLFGFSINTLTLFGLTLATGLVVDDAIVVIENIQRFIDEKGMTAREAAGAAMKEVSGAVVATSLVLMAVFAPVAFLPGTTGRIYQQFSLTIAFSVALSMFNSLTLTPALSARLLRRTPRQKNVVFRTFDRALDGGRRGYLSALRWLLRRRLATFLAYAAALAGAAVLYTKVPAGFLPQEDQGYLIVITQGPSGTSLGYTERVIEQIEPVLRQVPEIANIFQVPGFSFSGSGPNRAIAFIDLKPWNQRTKKGQSAAEIVDRLRGPLMGIRTAMIFPATPPAIEGVGGIGGFQFEIEDQGGGTVQELADQSKRFVAAASNHPDLVGMFSGFTADNPQLFLRVNRERAKELNVPLTDVFQTLQIYLGSAYVNDFTFSNRAYRVYVQADAKHRDNPKDLTSFYTRSRGATTRGLSATGLPLSGASEPAEGSMVSLDNLLSVEPRVSAGEVQHFNMFRAIEVNGAAAPGKSSGQAIAAMEKVAAETFPPGIGYEWTGIAREQIESGSQTFLVFGLALVLVFLVLAAQYESFSLPTIVMFSVPVGVLGALGGQLLRQQENDVFCQIGLVMLIGLSAKNAILIVEFANQLRERGLSIVDAAVEAARERLRPILMTSFAFILGVFPLVIAEGSGANARHSLGTTVFGGMLVSTAANLFFVPALYAIVEALRERLTHKTPHRAPG
jgi:HAE1 family hydrophobic/amphiphilic exporter-1